MLKFALILSLIFFNTTQRTYASYDPEFTDLVILYADGDYEKCLKKCLKYNDKSDTKREPLPYLYASMCYFEMSRDGQYQEAYPRAYKRALTYAVKYRKKDKNGVHYDDYSAYWSQLKTVTVEVTENYIDEAKHSGRNAERYYKKALYGMKKIVGFDPKDAGAWLMRGTLEFQTRNRTMGREYIKHAKELLEDITLDELAESSEKSQYLLRYAAIYSSKFYISQNREDEAKAILKATKPLFYQDHDELQITYNPEFKKLWDNLET